MGCCGMQQNQYRSTTDSFKFSETEIRLPSTASQNLFKIGVKKSFLQTAGEAHKIALAFWDGLQNAVKNDDIGSLDPAVIEEQAKKLSSMVSKGISFGGFSYVNPQGDKLPIIPVQRPGVPDPSRQYWMTWKVPTTPPLNDPERLLAHKIDCHNKTLLVIVYENDPDKREFVIDHVRPLTTNDLNLAADEVGLLFRLKDSPWKLYQAAVSHQKMIMTLNKALEEESKAVNNLNTWVVEYFKWDKELQALPKESVAPAPRAEPISSYELSNAIQRPKRGKSQASQSEEMQATSEIAKLPKPSVQPPQLTIDDEAAYLTYLTLVRAENNKVTWDQVVHCLRVLGFEVIEPTSGGNTWRFKYKNTYWIRDRETYEEMANEFHPEDTGTSQRAFHYPHQRGLSGQGPLDFGRLSSFRKLLDECLFDRESVTFKKE